MPSLSSLYRDLGHVFFWLTVATYFLTAYDERQTTEQRARFAVRFPRLWGLLVFLRGLGADSKRIKGGVVMMAKGLRSPQLAAWFEALPDPGEQATLNPPPPVAILAPPAPPPPTLARSPPRPAGQYSYRGDELPPVSVSQPGRVTPPAERVTPKDRP